MEWPVRPLVLAFVLGSLVSCKPRPDEKLPAKVPQVPVPPAATGPVRTVYVGNQGDQTISVHTLDTRTKLLRPRSYVHLPEGPPMALLTHDGFLHAAAGNSIVVLAVDPVSRDPSVRSVSSAGTRPVALAAFQRALYAASAGSHDVTVFDIDPTTGALTRKQTVAADTQPSSIRLAGGGRFVYVGTAAPNICTFVVQVDGTLSGPTRIPTRSAVTALSVNTENLRPREFFQAPEMLYAAHVDGTVSTWAIDASGTLARQDADPGTPGPQDLRLGTLPTAMTSLPEGAVLVATAGSVTTLEHVAPGGPLRVAGTQLAGVNPRGIAVDLASRQSMVVTGMSSHQLALLSVTTTGAVSPTGVAAARPFPGPVVFDVNPARAASAARVVLASGGTAAGGPSLLSFLVDGTTGALTERSRVTATVDFLRGIAVHPRLPIAYGVGENAAPQRVTSIVRYQLGLVDGTAVQSGPVIAPAGNEPLPPLTEPSGRFVYLPHRSGGTSDRIWTFRADPATGELTRMPGVTPSQGIEAAAIDPLGRFLYAIESVGGGIEAFRIDAASGALASLPGPVPAGVGVGISITVHPDGSVLYVSGEQGTASFAIDRSTGALTPIGAPIAQQFFHVAVHASEVRIAGARREALLVSARLDDTTGAVALPSGVSITGGVGDFATGIVLDPAGRFGYTHVNLPGSLAKVVPFTITSAASQNIVATRGADVPSLVGASGITMRAVP